MANNYGTKRDFYGLIDRKPDGRMLWRGATTTNHNTVDCEKYEYGDFELVTDVRSNIVKPTRLVHTKLVHRIMVYLTFGIELDRRYDVFALNGNRLDITPSNLGIRDTKSRQEWQAHEFFAANSNNLQALSKAA